MTVHLRAVVVLATGVALAGCGGADDKVTVGHLTFTVPEGWEEQEADGDWDVKFVGDGMELQVAGEFSEDPTASAAYSRLDLPAMVNLEGYQPDGIGTLEVEGADTALRADFTYADAGEPRDGLWVVAGQYPYPSTAALALSGPELDEEIVTELLASLTFTKDASR